MRSALKEATPTAARRLALAALMVVPFAGCFAEPQPEPDASGVGGAPATVGGATSLGGHATSRGGNAAGLGTDTSPIPDFGGAPGTGGSATFEAGFGGEEQGFSFKCTPPVADPIPARKSITSTTGAPPVDSGPTVLTLTKQSLFKSFDQSCGRNGSCHTGSDNPNAQERVAFTMTLSSFGERATLGDEALAHVTSSDPNEWMPPDLGDGSKRGPGNTFYDLAQKLLAWEKEGFPDQFDYTAASDDGAGGTSSSGNAAPYLLTPELGAELTNLGSCIPNDAALKDPVADEMQQKDALFASLQTSDDLPDTIFDTDLVSLDSGALSRRGVFSYAPSYPLFSDNAKKMRYVRVPVGKSIRYDETLRDFVIPDNTRFYKTFLKDVKGKDGSVGYRKMETRLIVVRQDTQNADGSYTTHALRASYAWNHDETMATRVKDPFRNQEPAADRLCPYIADETVTRDPAKNPISDQISDTCEYMTADEMKDDSSGRIRHYAIPSTQRCDQCHMGSSSHSFILGFTPWQIDRRKSGEGGVYEDPHDDELTQLQRFLDYGIVTGVEPGAVKLEESQLIADPPRSPRNGYELQAQAYMMGNCAFCHNPHGYPVVANPVLKEFELFPSKTGGIFQFPLEKFSPRAKAGVSQSHRLPYITAAFGDVMLDPSDLPPGGTQDTKQLQLFPPPTVDGDPRTTQYNPDEPDYDASTNTFTFLGPWRSLIWRNTYTPFTYSEDGTIFIHMPRNAVGYDCRVPHIMANWMLSIPVMAKPVTNGVPDQPVQEVSSTDPTQAYAYGQAVTAAKQRLQQYAEGVTGQWCPADDDIVDPKVVLSPVDPATNRKERESPHDDGITGARLVPDYPYPMLDSVPDHAHWIPTDTTEFPGKWVPRRSNWQDYIVPPLKVPVSDTLNQVINLLQNVHLSSDLEQFALEPLPMGLWDPACQSTPDASSTPTVADLSQDLSQPLRRWLKGGVIQDDDGPTSTLHVHELSRGQAVFQAICQNCHGKAVDSNSPLAATILEVTGGNTRVANFVKGLFGPPTAPDAYARDEFMIGQGATPDDWQARYVLFMGLGGTSAEIPLSVLSLVASSPFYGEGVRTPGATTPNMLNSALEFCYFVLGGTRTLPDTPPAPGQPGVPAPQITTDDHIFVSGNAHYELWESLCSLGNDPVVRVFGLVGGALHAQSSSVYRAKDDTGAWIYPSDALVGNQRGQLQHGIDPSNVMPWCIQDNPDPDKHSLILDLSATAGIPADSIPFCPAALFATTLGKPIYQLALDPARNTVNPDQPFGNQAFTQNWLLRGAMNAGLSAFYFMRGFTNGSVTPAEPFDFCLQ